MVKEQKGGAGGEIIKLRRVRISGRESRAQVKNVMGKVVRVEMIKKK